MARFCLDRTVLGTKDHLVVDEGKFWWAARVPSEIWHLSGSPKDDSEWCLDTLLRLAGRTVELAPPAPFVREMSFMSGSLEGVSIPWQKVMPARAHQSFVKGLVDQVVVAIDGTPQDYYRAVWVPGTQVLNALRPGFIDKGRWQELMAAGEGNVAAIRSFEPDARGFAQPVVYDRFKILTGRLTVQGGPQIHTLKREQALPRS